MSASDLSIGATGTTQATAYQMFSNRYYAQVSACTSSNNGINLPKGSIGPGSVFSIRNDGGYNLNVYPGTTGGTINGLSAGVPFVIAPNASCSLVLFSNNQSASLIWFSFGYMGPQPVIPISATATLTSATSGSIYAINPGTASFTITLPAPSIIGLQYEFILSAVTDATHTVTIASPSAVVYGLIENANTTYGPKVGSASTNVVFGTSTAGKIGDRVVLRSDGASWSAMGSTSSTVVTALEFS